jgi:Cu(I)/Ag(I) efflux system periplasmic protein CusF
MKRIAFALFALAFAGPVLAQMKGMDMKGMDMKAEQKSGTHKATGVVTRGAANGKVTIKHEPVESMKWPSMTMGFVVKDRALADKLKQGVKVEFEFVQQGKDYVVTGVK